MNSKIKLRAWDKQNKCMKVVTGLNFLYETSQTMNWGMQGSLTDVWLNGEDESYIPSDLVLLEFSGEKDIKGNEVYESSIIEWEIARDYKCCGVVRIKNCMYCVESRGATVTLKSAMRWGAVVLGNEFENPELMGRK